MSDEQTFEDRYTYTDLTQTPDLGEIIPAYDNRANRPVLIKRPSPDQPVADMIAAFAAQLNHEADLLAHPALAEHPNVYHLLERGETTSWWYSYSYIVLTRPAGAPLPQAALPLPQDAALALARQVAAALQAAEQAGYRHGSLTADIIYWDTARKLAQVIHWGQAAPTTDRDAFYDDLFRYGEIVYLALTGAVYDRVTAREWQANGGARWAIRGQFPLWAALLDNTLNPTPSARYTSLADLQAALDALAAEIATSATGPALDPAALADALDYVQRLPAGPTPHQFDTWLTTSRTALTELLATNATQPDLTTEYNRLERLDQRYQPVRDACAAPDNPALQAELAEFNRHLRTADYDPAIIAAGAHLNDLATRNPHRFAPTAEFAEAAERFILHLLGGTTDQLAADLYTLRQHATLPADTTWLEYFTALDAARRAIGDGQGEAAVAALAPFESNPVRERHWTIFNNFAAAALSNQQGQATLAGQSLQKALSANQAAAALPEVAALTAATDYLSRVRQVVRQFVETPAAPSPDLTALRDEDGPERDNLRQLHRIAEKCRAALDSVQRGQFAAAGDEFEHLAQQTRKLGTIAGIDLSPVANRFIDDRDACRICHDELQQILTALQARALPNELIERHLNAIADSAPALPNQPISRPTRWRDAFAAVSQQRTDSLYYDGPEIVVHDLRVSQVEAIYPLFARLLPPPATPLVGPVPVPVPVLTPQPEPEPEPQLAAEPEPEPELMAILTAPVPERAETPEPEPAPTPAESTAETLVSQPAPQPTAEPAPTPSTPEPAGPTIYRPKRRQSIAETLLALAAIVGVALLAYASYMVFTATDFSAIVSQPPTAVSTPLPTPTATPGLTPALLARTCAEIFAAERNDDWQTALSRINNLTIVAPNITYCDTRPLSQVSALAYFELGRAAYAEADFAAALEFWQAADGLSSEPPLALLLACAEARANSDTAALARLRNEYGDARVEAACFTSP